MEELIRISLRARINLDNIVPLLRKQLKKHQNGYLVQESPDEQEALEFLFSRRSRVTHYEVLSSIAKI
jgi:hypothetical protein